MRDEISSMLVQTKHHGLSLIEMNRAGRGNALSAAFVEALIAAVSAACEAPGVHTLVLRSAGKNFCTGFDLSDLAQETDATLLHRFVRVEMLLNALWMAPVRTVACVQGKAWGAGADLLAACDARILSPEATVRFPGAQFGLILGTRRLSARIGGDCARRCITEGLSLSADEALARGLATDIQADPGTEGLIARFGSPLIDRGTLAQVNAATRADHAQEDLARLVVSAAAPGLKQRISAYVAQHAKARVHL